MLFITRISHNYAVILNIQFVQVYHRWCWNKRMKIQVIVFQTATHNYTGFINWREEIYSLILMQFFCFFQHCQTVYRKSTKNWKITFNQITHFSIQFIAKLVINVNLFVSLIKNFKVKSCTNRMAQLYALVFYQISESHSNQKDERLSVDISSNLCIWEYKF